MKNIENAKSFERQVFTEVKSMIETEHCLDDIEAVSFDYYIDDFKRILKSRLKLVHYERHAETKEIIIEIDRPKFSDWLFRRRKNKKVKVELKEVLKESNALIKNKPFIEIIAIEEPTTKNY